MPLAELRHEMDKINDQILLLVKKRMVVAQKISRYKLKNGFSAYQPKRETEILRRIDKIAAQKDLPRKETQEIFKLIIKMGRDVQTFK
jgi:chorismate mutase